MIEQFSGEGCSTETSHDSFESGAFLFCLGINGGRELTLIAQDRGRSWERPRPPITLQVGPGAGCSNHAAEVPQRPSFGG